MSRYPAYAVVACDGKGHGAVIWHLGLQDAIEEPGLHELDDIGLDDAPQGIAVWEGTVVWDPGVATSNGPAEPDFDLAGDYRDPTDSEWAAIRASDNPFEYLRCHCVEESGLEMHTLDGNETDVIDVQCDDVAVADGLCERHWARRYKP